MSSSANMQLRLHPKSHFPPVSWRGRESTRSRKPDSVAGFRSLVKAYLESVTGTRYLEQAETKQATATIVCRSIPADCKSGNYNDIWSSEWRC